MEKKFLGGIIRIEMETVGERAQLVAQAYAREAKTNSLVDANPNNLTNKLQEEQIIAGLRRMDLQVALLHGCIYFFGRPITSFMLPPTF